MLDLFKEITWRQFGAAIDMLENSITICPDEFWGSKKEFGEFWYIAYHTLFWLDLYLSDDGEKFHPPLPFTLSELDYEGILPERIYTKQELLSYLNHGRAKCAGAIQNLTEEKARQIFKFGTIELTIAERFLYNMRHVQHHSAQLNLLLSQHDLQAPRWVRYTEKHIS